MVTDIAVEAGGFATKQGILIQGNAGQSVKAAAAGSIASLDEGIDGIVMEITQDVYKRQGELWGGNFMKIAVYAGTFDPITNGHLDIARRASCLFDRIIIAVARDNYKNTMFALEERCHMVREAVAAQSNITVVPFDCLLYTSRCV